MEKYEVVTQYEIWHKPFTHYGEDVRIEKIEYTYDTKEDAIKCLIDNKYTYEDYIIVEITRIMPILSK